MHQLIKLMEDLHESLPSETSGLFLERTVNF